MAGSLQIVHVLPERVRLRWPPEQKGEALDQLCSQLRDQSWLRQLQRRAASRSLVLELEPGCPALRWQLALAALGWQLEDGGSPASRPDPAQSPGAWDHLSRQLGGSMIGAALGQVVVGGGAASIATAVAGPPAALLFGAGGAVVGAVVGSIAGSAIADGQAETLPETLGQLSWRKLSTRMGEEVGSSGGMALGSALAGPVGAVAGLAVGSMLGGQVASDLSGPAAARAGIGQGRWFSGMLRDTTGETLTLSLASGLGARLSGGSELGRQLGASLGERFGRKVDWNASLQQHQLVPLRSTHPAGAPAPASAPVLPSHAAPGPSPAVDAPENRIS